MRRTSPTIVRALALAVLCPALAGQLPRYAELHHEVPSGGGEVALGDVDGDGDEDVLLGAGPADGTQLLLNRGDATFVDASESFPATPGESTGDLELADVDGDGDLDVLDAIYAKTGVPFDQIHSRLYLNDGAASFADASDPFPPALISTWDFAVGDLDGDGDVDAITANESQDEHVLLNDGAGTFVDGVLPEEVTGYQSQVLLVDVDGDGDLDAHWIGSGLFLNDGSASFTPAPSSEPGSDPALANQFLVYADFDGDGSPDRYRKFFLNAVVELNDGNGSFSEHPWTPPADGPVVAVDVDWDGDLDLFGSERIFRNDGGGAFGDGNLIFEHGKPYYLRPAAGDLDGDGDDDVFASTGWEHRVFLNDGPGPGELVDAAYESTRIGLDAVELGDLDGDGFVDAVGVGVPEVYLNDGFGELQAQPDALPEIPDGFDFGLVDIDGDGDLDGYASRFAEDELWLNDGSAAFSAHPGAIPLGTKAWSLDFGDLDGDGDADVVSVTSDFYGPFGLLLNDGAGGLTDASDQFVGSAGASTVELGDLDADGDLDAVVLHGAAGWDKIFFNDGAGVLLEGPQDLWGSALDPTTSVDIGDVDGDGDPDVVIGVDPPSGTWNRLFLNDGAGHMSPTFGKLPYDDTRTRAVALHDADGDGDLDVLVGNRTAVGDPAGQNVVYVNDGSGTFTADGTPFGDARGHTQGLAVADLDLDGDADLVTVDEYQFSGGVLRTRFDLTRQLAWRGLPRVGKALTLDLYGEPGGPWLLFGALGTLHLEVPPFGLLRLDPSTLFWTAAGPLDGEGRAEHSLQVPADPVLVGAALYWQALMDVPPRLSNAERTILTAF